jgi:hypothetical protein
MMAINEAGNLSSSVMGSQINTGVSDVSGGSSFGSTLMNLFQNKALLQMLSALGAGMGGKGSVAAALDKVNNQLISNQNYSKMLSNMLSDGGKVTMDKDKFNLTGPSSILNSSSQSGGSNVSAGDSRASMPNPFLQAP